MGLGEAPQHSTDICGCTCHDEPIAVRAGSVECRRCHAQICAGCCTEVQIDGADMPEFRCHDANTECSEP